MEKYLKRGMYSGVSYRVVQGKLTDSQLFCLLYPIIIVVTIHVTVPKATQCHWQECSSQIAKDFQRFTLISKIWFLYIDTKHVLLLFIVNNKLWFCLTYLNN